MPQSDQTKLAVITTKLEYIIKKVDDIEKNQHSNFVSKDEFEPIKRIVYGLVGLILVAVVGAMVSLVLRG